MGLCRGRGRTVIVMEGPSITDITRYFNSSTMVDLSPVLENGIPRAWSCPPLVVNPTMTHEHDGYFSQTVFLAEHLGSHVDAPYHIHADMPKDTIDVAPANALIGTGKLIDLSDLDLAPGEVASLSDVKRAEGRLEADIEENDVVLVNFGYARKYWSIKEWKFYSKNCPGLDEEVAKYLFSRKIKALGSDTFACGTPTADGKEEYCYIHHLLLRNKVYLMETLLNLDKLPGRFFFIALPLKFKGGSGSPIRALAFF